MDRQELNPSTETETNVIPQADDSFHGQHNPSPVREVNVTELITTIADVLKKLDYSNSSSFNDVSTNIHNIAVELQNLTSFQTEQNRRMRRLEEGYDFQIFKNFTKQIAREIFSLESLLAKTSDEDKREVIQDLIDAFVELLDRNSVSQITPEVGTLYAGQEKTIECAHVKVFTDDASLNGKIAAVVHTGFLYEFNDGSCRVIAPAKVLLFSNNQDQCSDAATSTLKLTDKAKEDIQRLTELFRSGKSTSSRNRSLLKLVTITLFTLLIVATLVLGIAVYRQSLIIQNLLSKDNSSQITPVTSESTPSRRQPNDHLPHSTAPQPTKIPASRQPNGQNQSTSPKANAPSDHPLSPTPKAKSNSTTTVKSTQKQ